MSILKRCKEFIAKNIISEEKFYFLKRKTLSQCVPSEAA